MNTPRAFRRSPIEFDAVPREVEVRDGWDVVLAFEDEPADGGSEATRLVDLSHRIRWDVQDQQIDKLRPFGLEVPPRPGEVLIRDGLLVGRMNRTQAFVWHVGPEPAPVSTESVAITETTDSHGWLAVIGEDAPEILEHLTNLDLHPPDRDRPFLTQGPLLHVPCQVVTWSGDCVLLAFSRGYGQTFADAMLHSVPTASLLPGGEHAFVRCISGHQPKR